MSESERETAILLCDGEGVILEALAGRETRARSTSTSRSDHCGDHDGGGRPEVTPGTRADKGSDDVTGDEARHTLIAELRPDSEAVHARVLELETELATMQERTQEEVSQLKEKVRSEKERCSALWWINCERLIEYDESLAERDEEIASLKARTAELEATPPVPSPPLSETGKTGKAMLIFTADKPVPWWWTMSKSSDET